MEELLGRKKKRRDRRVRGDVGISPGMTDTYEEKPEKGFAAALEN
jgi:hypothetical protein